VTIIVQPELIQEIDQLTAELDRLQGFLTITKETLTRAGQLQIKQGRTRRRPRILSSRTRTPMPGSGPGGPDEHDQPSNPAPAVTEGRLRRLVYLRRQRRRSPLDRSDPSGVNHQALHEVPEIAHRGAPDSRITPPSGLRGVLHRPLVRRATPYRHRVVRWCHRSSVHL